jgi:hypothetical protein
MFTAMSRTPETLHASEINGSVRLRSTNRKTRPYIDRVLGRVRTQDSWADRLSAPRQPRKGSTPISELRSLRASVGRAVSGFTT